MDGPAGTSALLTFFLDLELNVAGKLSDFAKNCDWVDSVIVSGRICSEEWLLYRLRDIFCHDRRIARILIYGGNHRLGSRTAVEEFLARIILLKLYQLRHTIHSADDIFRRLEQVLLWELSLSMQDLSLATRSMTAVWWPIGVLTGVWKMERLVHYLWSEVLQYGRL